LKKFILFFVISLTTVAVKAQGGYEYARFGIGVGVGYGCAFADIRKEDYHPAFNFGINYNFNPFLPVALEFQTGKLSGGGITPDKDPYGRQYQNNYHAFILHADAQAGMFFDYSGSVFLNAIRNFYIGTGIGQVYNKIVVLQRGNPPAFSDPSDVKNYHGELGSTNGFQPANQNTNLLIPIRVGYEFKIFDSYDRPACTITVGYQHNFTTGEGLDGYNDPTPQFKNNSKDQYGQFSIGIKYNFIGITEYSKSIKY
jgi:hypothetical protein